MFFPPNLRIQALADCLLRLSRRELHTQSRQTSIVDQLPAVDQTDLALEEHHCPICLGPYGQNRGDGTTEEPVRIQCSHVIGRRCLAKFHTDKDLLDPVAFAMDKVSWYPRHIMPSSFFTRFPNLRRSDSGAKALPDNLVVPKDLVYHWLDKGSKPGPIDHNTSRCMICRQVVFDALLEWHRKQGAFRGPHAVQYRAAEKISDKELLERLLSLGAHFDSMWGWIWCGHRILGPPLAAREARVLVEALSAKLGSNSKEIIPEYHILETKTLGYLSNRTERKLLLGDWPWMATGHGEMQREAKRMRVSIDRLSVIVQSPQRKLLELDQHERWIRDFLGLRQDMMDDLGAEGATVAATLFEFRKYSSAQTLSIYASRSRDQSEPITLVGKAMRKAFLILDHAASSTHSNEARMLIAFTISMSYVVSMVIIWADWMSNVLPTPM